MINLTLAHNVFSSGGSGIKKQYHHLYYSCERENPYTVDAPDPLIQYAFWSRLDAIAWCEVPLGK